MFCRTDLQPIQSSPLIDFKILCVNQCVIDLCFKKFLHSLALVILATQETYSKSQVSVGSLSIYIKEEFCHWKSLVLIS